LEAYEKLGCFQERLISLVKKGKLGAEEIDIIMDRFRKAPPKHIDGSPILFIEDYATGVRSIVKKQEKEMISLPKANVLIFIAEDGTQIAARPSGTEPKIKFYVSVNTSLNSTHNYRIIKDQLDKKMDRILAELGI
jgi:phosphoglucomutase